MNICDYNPSFYIPEAMQKAPNWVLWTLEENDEGKVRKMPYNAKNSLRASSQKPEDWTDFATATHVLRSGKYRGVGFMLGGSGLVFVDVDHAIDVDGCFNDQAAYIMEALRGSAYCELSQSGSGLHFFVIGEIPRSFRNSELGVEMYSNSGHYAAMTGRAIYAREPEADPEAIRCIFNRFKTKEYKQEADVPQIFTSKIMSDDQVIMKAAAAPYSGESFKALFSGEWAGCYESQSEADLRLCQLLAFWCNCDQVQIDRIFRSSGLYRKKWDREGYRMKTIARACSSQIGVTEWAERKEQDRRRRIALSYAKHRNQI